jgi:putative colanic acid biosynthesis UDP-glucose lipid carrier transferase
MPNHRDRGYALMHRLCLLVFVSLWFWVSVYLWERWDFPLINLPWNYALVAVAGLIVATFGTLQNYGSFFVKSGWCRIRESVAKANFQTSLIAFFVFGSYFATKDNETSRLFLAFYLSTCWPLLIASNFALPGFFKRLIGFGSINRKSVILGEATALDGLSNWIARHAEHGFSFEGTFSNSSFIRSSPDRLPWLGPYAKLEEFLGKHKIHQLIILPDRNMDNWIPLVTDLASQHGCRVLIYNTLSGFFDSRLVFVEESGRQFFSLQNEPLESPFNQMLKRSFDLCVSLPALLLVFPLCMLLVKTFQMMQSSGPLFFCQERVGLAGKRFVIWKFRSMVHDETETRDEAVQASPDDERIFSFGRFMRRFSIDEIPQFLNVLKGEMSLVGPRPYLAEHDYLFQRDYKAYRIRQFVKPGVTGPAQCRGLRGEFTDPALVRRRIELDFNYVGNWSIWLDFEIVLRTVGQVLFPPKSAC